MISLKLQNLSQDIQDAEYHFDAIVSYNVEKTATYTSFPLEFGADPQDHAYNNPDQIVISGVTGSTPLTTSVNQLPGAGRGNSATANAAYLGGNNESKTTRPQSTLEFLTQIKESFVRFDVVTGLTEIRNLKIDSITTEVNEVNEYGLEFVITCSQKLEVGRDRSGGFASADLPDNDPAKTQAATLENRGRVNVESPS